jgi:hypothetical protein
LASATRTGMTDEKRQRLAADAHIDFQAITLEDTFMRLDPQQRKFGIVNSKIIVGEMRVTGHVDEFDRLAVTGLIAHQHSHVDATAVIALDHEFVPVALSNHLEQITELEGVQRADIVDLLQAENIRMGFGDRQRGQLPRVVGVGDRPPLFKLPVLLLILYLEELQCPVLVEIVLESRKIETVHEVFDIESGDANGHAETRAIEPCDGNDVPVDENLAALTGSHQW